MLLVISKDTQILEFIPIHHSGLSNDLNLDDGPDPHWNVR